MSETNSALLMDILRKYEGDNRDEAGNHKAYQDNAGVWTIGFGHTGKDVSPDTLWTDKQANDALAKDMGTATSAYERLVKVPLTPAQRASVTSLIYNVGEGAFSNSRALHHLNRGDFPSYLMEANDPSKGFTKITQNGQKVISKGLVNRRALEGELFSSEEYVPPAPGQQAEAPAVDRLQAADVMDVPPQARTMKDVLGINQAPVKEDIRAPAGRFNTMPDIAAQEAAAAAKPTPSLWEVVRASARVDNTLGDIFAAEPQYKIDLNYDPKKFWAANKEELESMQGMDREEVIDLLGSAVSPAHAEERLNKIRQDYKDEQLLLDAGMKALIPRLAISILDPVDIGITFATLPASAAVAGSIKAGRWGRIITGAIAAGGATGGTEALLAANSAFRDETDVAFATAAGFVLGGALSGIGKSANERLNEIVDHVARGEIDEAARRLGVDSAGARRVAHSSDGEPTKPLAPKQEQTTDEILDEIEAPEFRFKFVNKIMQNFQNTLFYSGSEKVRKLSSRMLEGGFLKGKGVRGFTAEGRAQHVRRVFETGVFGQSLPAFKKWAERNGHGDIRRLFTTSTGEEFYSQVGRAMRGNMEGLSDEAVEAAQAIRPFMDNMYKLAEAAGVKGFGPGSYVAKQVMYHGTPAKFGAFDVSKANPNDPDDVVNGIWFTSSQDEAQIAGEFPWGRPNAPDANVRQVTIDLQNPATRADVSDAAKEARIRLKDGTATGPNKTVQEETRLILTERGHDGFVRQDVRIDAEKLAKDGELDLGNGKKLVDEGDQGVGLYDEAVGGHVTSYENIEDAVKQLQQKETVVFDTKAIKDYDPDAPSGMLDDYFPRLLNKGKFNEMIRRVGTEGMEKWYREAIMAGNDDIPEELAMKIARGYVHTMRHKIAGLETDLLHGIRLDDVEKLRELFQDFDGVDEIIDGLEAIKLREQGQRGTVSYAKRRIKFDEGFSAPVRDMEGNEILLKFDDMLENDARKVLKRYGQIMSGHIGMAKELGIRSRSDFDNVKAALISDAERTGGDMKIAQDEVIALDESYNLLLGQPIEPNPSGNLSMLARTGTAFTYTTRGGQFGINALAEAGNIVGNAGIRSFLRSIPEWKSMMKRAVDGNLDHDLARTAELLFAPGIHTLTGHAIRNLDELGEGFEHGGKLGRALNKADPYLKSGGRATSILSGLGPITDLTQRIAGVEHLRKLARFANGGKISKGQAERLRAAGLSDEMQERVFKMFREAGVYRKGRLIDLDVEKWTDVDALDALNMSATREFRNIIQENDISTVTKYFHHPLGRVILQFMRFPMEAVNKQLLRGVHHADVETATSWAASLLIGSTVYMAQTSIEYANDPKERKKRLSPENIARVGFMRTGFSSMIPPVWDNMMYPLGVDPMFALGRSSGLGTQSISANPLASTVEKGVKGVFAIPRALLNDDIQFNQQDFRNLASVVPGYRLLGAKNGVHAIEQMFPEDRKQK